MSEDLILSPEDRTRLDGIVSEMINNGESDEFIQNVVNDYKSKYAKKKILRNQALFRKNYLLARIHGLEEILALPSYLLARAQKLLRAVF